MQRSAVPAVLINIIANDVWFAMVQFGNQTAAVCGIFVGAGCVERPICPILSFIGLSRIENMNPLPL